MLHPANPSKRSFVSILSVMSVSRTLSSSPLASLRYEMTVQVSSTMTGSKSVYSTRTLPSTSLSLRSFLSSDRVQLIVPGWKRARYILSCSPTAPSQNLRVEMTGPTLKVGASRSCSAVPR